MKQVKKPSGVAAASLWFIGVIAALLTAILAALVGLQVGYGIDPSTMRGFMAAWFFTVLIIACVPALLVALSVADEREIAWIHRAGRHLTLYCNVGGWVFWAASSVISVITGAIMFLAIVLPPEKKD